MPVPRSELCHSAASAPAPSRVERISPAARWSQQAQRLRTEALVFYFAFRHPRVRWYARLVAVSTAIYLLSPVQLIPSYIPVIGFLDDFLVLFLGVKLLRRIVPREVLAECVRRAEAVEAQRKEKIRSAGAAAGLLAVISLVAPPPALVGDWL